MRYLHTMVRVTDIAASLRFYCDALGLRELARNEYPKGRYTLVFLAAPGDERAQVELQFFQACSQPGGDLLGGERRVAGAVTPEHRPIKRARECLAQLLARLVFL